MAVFFLHSFLIANWAPRIPDVAAGLRLELGDLSLALLGMPIGTFIAIAVSGSVVERLTPRLAILAFFPLYCLVLAGVGFAPGLPALFLALVAVGMTYSFVDIAMNVEAARIQDALGRVIMSTVHGFWSVGFMVGVWVGGKIGEAGVPVGIHLLVVCLVGLPVAVLLALNLPSLAEGRAAGTPRPPVLALPTLGLIGLCIFASAAVVIEATQRNFGGVFLRDTLGASPSDIGTALAAYSLAMAAGRFVGDAAVRRFGAVAVARGCGVIATAGIVLFASAGSVPVAAAGLAALGLGGSLGFPLAVTAASRRTDRPAATNVAAMALFVNAASLASIPIIGFVSEWQGVRIGVAILLPVIVASTLLAGQLRRASR
jgi:predicted MFS family arabinose efflux permease